MTVKERRRPISGLWEMEKEDGEEEDATEYEWDSSGLMRSSRIHSTNACGPSALGQVIVREQQTKVPPSSEFTERYWEWGMGVSPAWGKGAWGIWGRCEDQCTDNRQRSGTCGRVCLGLVLYEPFLEAWLFLQRNGDCTVSISRERGIMWFVFLVKFS